MKILISNDDGIYSTGIQALVAGLVDKHDVYVVAPDRERSATGHAITLHKPIRVEEADHLDGVKAAFMTDGNPSDCVKLAVGELIKVKPDMVISGINHGPNMGADILYSGTVSAAMEGAIFNIPSIAVSVTNHKVEDFDAAVKVVKKVVDKIGGVKFPDKTLLNINVPYLEYSELAGFEITDLGVREYDDHFEKRIDPRGKTYYWLTGEAIEETELPGTDVYAVRSNLVSITPITIHMTNDGMMEDLKGWAKDITL